LLTNIKIFISLVLLFGACTAPEDAATEEEVTAKEIKNRNQICFNHSLLVLDSSTYAAAVNSAFLTQFAFSHEKQLPGYKGLYLIGATTYLEIFHPKSVAGEELKAGEFRVFLASLKANHLKKLNGQKLNHIVYESDDEYNYLSLMINDSTTPITTWEMKKEQYESWTKKEFLDSIAYLPVDYNSPQESDSSANYWMKDLVGIGLSLSAPDTSTIISYLQEIGFDQRSTTQDGLRFSDGDQFFELHLTNNRTSPTIDRYYIELNKPVTAKTEFLGKSRIECAGTEAIWYFE